MRYCGLQPSLVLEISGQVNEATWSTNMQKQCRYMSDWVLGLLESQFRDMALIAMNARPAAIRACWWQANWVKTMSSKVKLALPPPHFCNGPHREDKSIKFTIARYICQILFYLKSQHSSSQNLFKPIGPLTVRCLPAFPPGRCGKPRLFQTSSMISFSSLPQTSVIVAWVCPQRLLDWNGTSPMQNLFIQRIFNFFGTMQHPTPAKRGTNYKPTQRPQIGQT